MAVNHHARLVLPSGTTSTQADELLRICNTRTLSGQNVTHSKNESNSQDFLAIFAASDQPASFLDYISSAPLISTNIDVDYYVINPLLKDDTPILSNSRKSLHTPQKPINQSHEPQLYEIRTLSAVLWLCSEGDIVIIAPGIYNETNSLSFVNTKQQNAPVPNLAVNSPANTKNKKQDQIDDKNNKSQKKYKKSAQIDSESGDEIQTMEKTKRKRGEDEEESRSGEKRRRIDEEEQEEENIENDKNIE
ncbi:MAG: hypothetical protein EZS28_050427, partial [Streblomastix strix]